jgi:hypothetical protein
MDFISEILNFSKYGDASVYFIIGFTATLLFTARLMMALFIGDDGGDADMDGGVSGDTDASFQIFSLLSITAFFMGVGWMGVACRYDWQMGGSISMLISVGFGTFLMFGSAFMMNFIRSLSQEKTWDVTTAKDTVGRVYLTVPAHGEGRGQVAVTVSGRRKILEAASTGVSIASHLPVRVVDTCEDGSLVVEPVD